MTGDHIHSGCGHRCPCPLSHAALCFFCLLVVTGRPIDQVVEVRVVKPILQQTRRPKADLLR